MNLREENNFSEEKNRKAKVIEGMLSEIGMTKQELIDLLVSVKKERAEEVGALQETDKSENSLSDFTEAEIAQMFQGDVSGELQKYLSYEELKKLEVKVSFAFHLKKSLDNGSKVDIQKLAKILEFDGKDLTLNKGAKIDIGGISKVIESRKAEASIDYLQSLSGQSQSQDKDKSKNVSSPKAQTFLSRLMGAVSQQTQAALSSIVGSSSGQQQDPSVTMNRMQSQLRVVESANRQLRRQEEKARSRLGDVSKVSRRGKETFVTTRVRTRDGKIEFREVNSKDLAKAKNVPQGEADKLIADVEKAEKAQSSAVESMNQKMPENTKILGISFDDKGKMQYEVLIKGEKKTIPAENLVVQVVEVKKESSTSADGKSKGYEVTSELKIYEQVGSFKDKTGSSEKVERKEKNENLKSDLHKLDAISDRQKNLEEQKKENHKEGVKSEIGSDRPEATKKASDVTDQEKDPSLKYAIKAVGKPVEFDPKEKTEVKESVKTDDTLKKLDALHDKQKLMESLKEVKDTMKSAVHDKMDEAMQNKDLLKDMEKDRLKNLDIGIKK